MNWIKKRITDIVDDNALTDEELGMIMKVIEEYLEEAFDAAKDQRHLGCGDYEDMYWDWKVWYDEEVNI